MGIAILSVLSVIAICCIFITYKQFQKPTQQTQQNNCSKKKKQVIFNANTVTVKKAQNGFTIIRFTNEIEKRLESTNSITYINICIEHIQSYWIDYTPPYSPTMSNVSFSNPEPAKLSIFISIGGIEYQLTNKKYSLIEKVREEFESHYLVE